jgi:hypothetical protein
MNYLLATYNKASIQLFLELGHTTMLANTLCAEVSATTVSFGK